MKKISTLLLSCCATLAMAQADSTGKLSISGYAEAYHTYDLGNPENHTRPGFVYSHNRHNETNINIAFLKANYSSDKLRSNLALMTGTYANANLAAEPGVLKNIFEANVGVKISKKNNLWVDAGIFGSHIGFESAIGKDCWNLTRSILADNSPYFESGVKIGYTSKNEKWFLSGLVLNGWQNITRTNANNTPAFGHQITYKPNGKVTLNSSSFVGNVMPDSVKAMRYFHNFYGIFQLTEKLGLTLGFDYGMQQKAKGSSDYNTWFSPVVIVKAKVCDKVFLSARGEYYQDIAGVIIATGTTNGFQTYGYSLNLDYQIRDNMMWRIEGRNFTSKDQIFMNGTTASSQNTFVSTALAISF